MFVDGACLVSVVMEFLGCIGGRVGGTARERWCEYDNDDDDDDVEVDVNGPLKVEGRIGCRSGGVFKVDVCLELIRFNRSRFDLTRSIN